MSGRLIILPKKTYCPWNPSNVERVLRDEREHAEAEKKEQNEKKKEESRARMQRLTSGTKQPAETIEATRLEHVNLFAEEEKELENLQNPDSKSKQDKTGVRPLYLGQSAKDSKTFYHGTTREEADKPNRKDDRLKAKMDPMRDFHIERETTQARPSKKQRASKQESPHAWLDSDGSTDSSERRRVVRRRKKSKRRRKEGDSIEELRQRRAEREERERQRQDEIRKDSSGRRNSRYVDQYHPHISRN